MGWLPFPAELALDSNCTTTRCLITAESRIGAHSAACYSAPMDQQDPGTGARRYLKTREKPWAQKLARGIGKTGITPNMISVLSVGFAIFGALCLMTASNYSCKPCATWIWAGAAI